MLQDVLKSRGLQLWLLLFSNDVLVGVKTLMRFPSARAFQSVYFFKQELWLVDETIVALFHFGLSHLVV